MKEEICSMPAAPLCSETMKPTAMPRSLVLLFAIASGLSVANVYYAQPLLDMLARDFAISQAAVGGVVTATQVGCALALLLLVPLGDIVERRRLMLLQLLALIAALGIVVMAQSAWVLLVGMLTGLLGTAMAQGLIACAASAAEVQERGRVVGAAQGGVFIGLLLARVFAGVVSDLAGWRAVYGASALMMLVLLPLLWRQLPRFGVHPESVSAVLDADITLYRSRIANSRRAGVVNVCRLYDFLECNGAPAKCASLWFFTYSDWAVCACRCGGSPCRDPSRARCRPRSWAAHQFLCAGAAIAGMVAPVTA